jgi:hypothetical protein
MRRTRPFLYRLRTMAAVPGMTPFGAPFLAISFPESATTGAASSATRKRMLIDFVPDRHSIR